jgi:mRNA interferase RelE/StbE
MLPVVYTPMAEKYFKKLKDKQLKNSFKEAIVSIRTNNRRRQIWRSKRYL